jgi:ankyrin repeat protein
MANINGNMKIQNMCDVMYSKPKKKNILNLFVRSVQALIANKADVNAGAREDGSTPLHFASMSGSVDCVRILIENKANVNARSFALYTPLHDAVGVGAVDCAKLLLDNGAEVNAKNKVIAKLILISHQIFGNSNAIFW